MRRSVLLPMAAAQPDIGYTWMQATTLQCACDTCIRRSDTGAQLQWLQTETDPQIGAQEASHGLLSNVKRHRIRRSVKSLAVAVDGNALIILRLRRASACGALGRGRERQDELRRPAGRPKLGQRSAGAVGDARAP